MTYQARLTEVATWLLKHQNDDGGWGLTKSQGSSIVNTAEALYVLHAAGIEDDARVAKALMYFQTTFGQQIKSNLNSSQGGGFRTRYATFSIVGLSLYRRQSDANFLAECVRCLMQARNADGAWGTLAGDRQSTIFSTFSALWALQAAGINQDDLQTAKNWILGNALESGGWAIAATTGAPPSVAATAYGLLALNGSKQGRSQQYKRGVEFLLQSDITRTEEEYIAGTLWRHCTYAWAIPALVKSGIAPYEPKIAEAIRVINSRYKPGDGWNEVDTGNTGTIRSQFWACLALNSAKEAFDPQVHIPRIDAERTQPVLAEPQWVKMALHSRWATILPSDIYKAIVWSVAILSIVIGVDLTDQLSRIPDSVEFGFAAVLAWLAWKLIRARPVLFPKKLHKAVAMGVALAGAIIALYDLNPYVLRQSLSDSFAKYVVEPIFK